MRKYIKNVFPRRVSKVPGSIDIDLRDCMISTAWFLVIGEL